jgi:N-sulfoglucosamine sulfohydrolase
MNRPNILYLHSHDTGRHVQPYGRPVATPRIQQLAEEGVLFRRAFCAAPSCSPSRAALLTGQSAHSSGMLGLAHRGWLLHDYRQHLIHTLHGAGYHSALAGVQHVAPEPGGAARIGYRELLPTRGHLAEDVVPPVLEFLSRPHDAPFFLSVGFVETHLLPGEHSFGYGGGDGRYAASPAPLPDTPRVRQTMADYQQAASTLDWGVGAVLDALARAGLTESTLVICTTDHGLPLPGMKCTLADGGLEVMLMLRGPGGFAGGRVLDGLVSQIDLFPTLCDLLELPPPPWLQGRSLMPLVRGEAAEVNEAVFGEVTHHVAYDPQRSVRTGRYKYIQRFGERARPVLSNTDDSPAKDEWLASGWQTRERPFEMLYDLVFDPNEGDNLAGDARHREVLEDLRGRLERWMRETDDPLLEGPVPVPPGTKDKDPDAVSPKEP